MLTPRPLGPTTFARENVPVSREITRTFPPQRYALENNTDIELPRTPGLERELGHTHGWDCSRRRWWLLMCRRQW